MPHQARARGAFVFALAAIIAVLGTDALTQAVTPTNSLPNPYRAIEDWAKLPRAVSGARPARSMSTRMARASGWPSDAARKASSPSPNGRKDQPFNCVGSKLDPILKFDASAGW